MTEQQRQFNYYCLDRIRNFDDELRVAYKDEDTIRKLNYRIGIEARIKHTNCYVLYLEDNFDDLVYVSKEFVDDHREDLFLHTQEKEVFIQEFKHLPRINIFQFVSMMTFIYIYEYFKSIIDYNWNYLNLDSLVEI